MPNPAPLWKMPTRDQAREVLVFSRSRTLALVDQLDDKHLKTPTQLGGGTWSIEDLLGHLAGYQEQAVAIATGKKPRFDFAKFGSVDERNAADIERKRDWTVKRVRQDLETMRSDLLEAIDAMTRSAGPRRYRRERVAPLLRLLSEDYLWAAITVCSLMTLLTFVTWRSRTSS